MPAILVDSNILIDLFDYQSQWHEWSKKQLKSCGNREILGSVDIHKEIIYVAIKTGGFYGNKVYVK